VPDSVLPPRSRPGGTRHGGSGAGAADPDHRSVRREFEAALADYLQVKHVLAVTRCTGAMHMSLLALGIGPGDEVITTPMTFIATRHDQERL
jgi:hypothetical protein